MLLVRVRHSEVMTRRTVLATARWTASAAVIAATVVGAPAPAGADEGAPGRAGTSAGSLGWGDPAPATTELPVLGIIRADEQDEDAPGADERG